MFDPGQCPTDRVVSDADARRLAVGPPDFAPKLIIFDKDGTLIDFHLMWGTWIRAIADRLQALTGRDLAAALFQVVGYVPESGQVLADGALALAPVPELQELMYRLLLDHGLFVDDARRTLAEAWFVPDPVELARPLADLYYLFGDFQRRNITVAVATSDDHAPTVRTLERLGVAHLVAAVVGADDVLAIKPAPDMVLRACAAVGVTPAETVMVGDNLADLQMGRAAGVGLNIGVLSGLGAAADLAPFADLLLDSIAQLM